MVAGWGWVVGDGWSVAVERSGQSFPPIKANDVKSFIFMVPKWPPRRSAGRIFGRGQFAGRGSTATRDGPATVIENTFSCNILLHCFCLGALMSLADWTNNLLITKA